MSLVTVCLKKIALQLLTELLPSTKSPNNFYVVPTILYPNLVLLSISFFSNENRTRLTRTQVSHSTLITPLVDKMSVRFKINDFTLYSRLRFRLLLPPYARENNHLNKATHWMRLGDRIPAPSSASERLNHYTIASWAFQLNLDPLDFRPLE